ncbi:hypothetical protein GSI_14517 [Ganoderma sinense ZZ0214-1]|uniref:Uncharacterized protein n=1 Tax=Ganoderma sinense ZZ0214-1 TaxID=1077348 RepID=A0A2G8RPE8_9APHY|nr:hypothetical protein GSI_14517 [Ganoderma sinense ZZ0214-1]
MNQDPPYHLFDGLDDSHYPPTTNTLHGGPLYNTVHGYCPAIFPMSAGSLGCPSPQAATNTGPFVVMHIDHYLNLMRRLEVPFEPVDPAIGHASEPATRHGMDEVVSAVRVPSRDVEAPGGGLNSTAGTQVGNHPVRKPHKMRSKVARRAQDASGKTSNANERSIKITGN